MIANDYIDWGNSEYYSPETTNYTATTKCTLWHCVNCGSKLYQELKNDTAGIRLTDQWLCDKCGTIMVIPGSQSR